MLGISKAIQEGNGNAIIYTALIAAILANCTPTIADGYYFSMQQKWKQELEEEKISVEDFWRNNLLGYYVINAGYYASLLALMLALGKTDYSVKAKVLFSLAGGGVIIGVALKNIEKDKQLAALKKSAKDNQPKA